jgi:polysaccharide pyruvyl transferase WcaK-like protein
MIFHVFANEFNLGDALSAQGIRQQLVQMAPSIRYRALFCDLPYLSETVRVIKNECRPHDLVIFGGGGLFMDYFEPLWAWFLRLRAQRNLRFVLWGVGLCSRIRNSSDTRADQDLLNDVVKNALLASLRDSLTYEPFKRFAHCYLIGCPSLNRVDALQRARQERLGKLLYVHHSHLVDQKERELLMSVILESNLSMNHLRLSFQELDNIVTPPDTPESYLARHYQGADIVVSSRLHGLVLAAGMGAKVIAIAKDEKICSFMAQIGMSEWNVQTAGELWHALATVHLQRACNSKVRQIVSDNQNFSLMVLKSLARSSAT